MLQIFQGQLQTRKSLYNSSRNPITESRVNTVMKIKN